MTETRLGGTQTRLSGERLIPISEGPSLEGVAEATSLRLLLVDDNRHDRELLARSLRQHFTLVDVELADVEPLDRAAFERAVEMGGFDAAIIDYQVRWSNGIDILRAIKGAWPDCPVIMFTASGTEEVAVEAMKQGLDDYVTKTANHYARLPFALSACLARREHRRELECAHSERAALAGQARSSEQRLQLALSAAGMLAWEHELAGDRLMFTPAAGAAVTARWNTASEAMAALFGDELAEVRARYQRVIASGQPFKCELRARLNPDKPDSWIEMTGRPMRDAGGTITHVLGVLADISERRQIEEELRQADQRKDRFLATLAHELRNPLAPIRYATRLLDPSVPAQMAADARHMIDRQLGHMARLLDDLLDVSRVSRGTLELRCELLDLRGVIETAVRDARPAAQAGRRTLAVQLPQEPLPVMGDPNRLAQILGNLLSNATKYTKPGGHIAVDSTLDGAHVVVRVRDDGIGIAPEFMPKLFELFAQAEPRAGRPDDGLGIGLSLARELAQLHDGQLEASSGGAAQGSEFTLRLPRVAEKPAVSEPVAAADKVVALGAEDVRLLVIDDNRDSADTLCSLLSLAGYDTRVAYDGTGALRVAEEFRPAVALLDIGLPDRSGHEVARLLRSRPWASHLRLIAISGWGQEADRARSREAGIDEHLTKPVDPQMLLQLVMRLTRTEPAGASGASRSLNP